MAASDLIRDINDPDPSRSLPAVRALRELIEAAQERGVVAARKQGLAWQTIADLLGRTRSSVWERYQDITD